METESTIVNRELTEEEIVEMNKSAFQKKVEKLLPILMLSIAIHSLILLILLFFGAFEDKKEKKINMIIIQEYIEPIEPEEQVIIEKPDIKVEDLKVPEIEKDTISEVEDTPDTLTETDNNDMEAPDVEIVDVKDIVESIAESNFDAPPILSVVSDNAPAGGLPASVRGTGLDGRGGPDKGKAIEEGGGDPKPVLNAVDLALKWLKNHQEADGSWDSSKYEGAGTYDKEKIASTAIALLAFLGDGHSEHTGKYKSTVRRGMKYLNKTISTKIRDGHKPYYSKNYASALALQALSEASIFGSTNTTKKNANHIAKMFIDQFGEDVSYDDKNGWSYNGKGDDFSVSGWIALGLKSAKLADLEEMKTAKAHSVMEAYRNWVFEVMTDEKEGTAKYRENVPSHKINMTWIGMFVKRFYETPKDDLFLKNATLNTMTWMDKYIGGDTPKDSYGIYYGTLSSFQMGLKSSLWKKWNHQMLHTLLTSQRKGDTKELGGSWDPTSGLVGKHGGRVMDTAIFALCLEVYYRFQEYEEN